VVLRIQFFGDFFNLENFFLIFFWFEVEENGFCWLEEESLVSAAAFLSYLNFF